MRILLKAMLFSLTISIGTYNAIALQSKAEVS